MVKACYVNVALCRRVPWVCVSSPSASLPRAIDTAPKMNLLSANHAAHEAIRPKGWTAIAEGLAAMQGLPAGISSHLKTERRFVFDFRFAASYRRSALPENRPAQRLQLFIAVMTLALSVGCFHSPAPYQPTRWPGRTAPIDVLSDSARHPVLQILIAYNVYWPNHTALRLVVDSGQTLFWDPGGGYGKATSDIVRRSDLIIEDAPSLATYMVYRWTNNDQVVEIFEWVLTHAEARRLAASLRAGAARTDFAETGFRTATPGFFCNAAVSSFLFNYGGPSLHLGDSYLLPSLLSRELYTRHPDRVMLLKRDHPQSVLVLRPPDGEQEVADFKPEQP